MTASAARPTIIEIVRREWWLVLVVTVVAVIVAFLASQGTPDVYTGRTSVVVDAYNISRFKGIPTPDELVTESTGALANDLAAAAGIDPADLKQSLNLSIVGNPPRRLVVMYRADSEQAAKDGAEAIAGALADYSTSRAGVAIRREERVLEAAKASLAEIEKDPEGSAYERYALTASIVDAETTLEILKTIYLYEGEPSVTRQSASTGQRDALVAGLFVGVVLGIVLAVVREAFVRYRLGR